MNRNSDFRSILHRAASGFTLVEVLVVIAIIGILVGLSLPALQAVRESSRRAQCQFNLSQIGLAIAEYHGSHAVFPSGTRAESGPIQNVAEGYHHNWIEGLLPHLDAMPIYKAIDREVSIYAATNEPAREAKLSVVKCPSAPGAASHDSNYAGSHHPREQPIDVSNDGIFFLNTNLSRNDIPDGLAYTLFVGEKLPGAEDLGYLSGTRATLRNAGHPIGDALGAETDDRPEARGRRELYVGGFASAHPQGAHFMMGDGSIEFFGTGMDLAVLQQSAHRSDGALPK